MELSDVKALAERIRAEVSKAIIGQQDTVDLMLTALFSGGHILLEGAPGTGKTLLAQSLAASLALEFGRIQFTPDLMPGDIVGTNLFNFQTSTFSTVKGPIFCDLLLADEINRTPPKTQAALLEAMQERKVTLDGKTHQLHERFMVVATENPIEQQGTYPLPEAQLDRFLFKQVMNYPDEAQEIAIVAAMSGSVGMPDPATLGVTAVADREVISSAIAAVATVRLADAIVRYIVSIVRETRASADLSWRQPQKCGQPRRRVPRLRHVAGPRLCHSRRCEGAAFAGAAASRDSFSCGRDRRAADRGRDQNNNRAGSGTAMNPP